MFKKGNRLSLWLLLGTVAISFYLIAVNFQTVREAIFAQQTTAFRFASLGDSHDQTSAFSQTLSQVKSMNPAFIIHNGDLEDDGVATGQMTDMVTTIGDQLSKIFIVRGNHDDHMSGSASLWENYFVGKYGAARALPAGVTNYVAMDANSTYLTYSFDYGNSRFIGADAPGDADLLTSAEYSFIDSRLTNAESSGLTHAFIYWHGPEYCVEETHCSCTGTTGCGPTSQLLTIINKHPILSASFHGHEHILAWVHMGPTRVPGITHEYEEFITSSSGLPYSFTVYPARMDYYNFSSSQTAYATIDVNGPSFTVNFYHTSSTTPLWTKTFTKSGATVPPGPTISPTPTGSSTTGDVNGDGVVNIIDIGILIDNYGKSPIPNPKADVNHDGVVNIIDIGILIDNYGK